MRAENSKGWSLVHGEGLSIVTIMQFRMNDAKRMLISIFFSLVYFYDEKIFVNQQKKRRDEKSIQTDIEWK